MSRWCIVPALFLMCVLPCFGEDIQVLLGNQEAQYSLTAMVLVDPAGNLADFSQEPLLEVPYVQATQFRWSKDDLKLKKVFVYIQDSAGTGFDPCVVMPGGDSGYRINPSTLRCTDGSAIRKTALFLLEFDNSEWFGVKLNNRKMPVAGSDMGVALTLIDRWEDPNGPEGARVLGGASVYYSLAKLRTDRYRFISNVSVLDMDDEIDFEVGVGFGLMFRSGKSEPNNPGFSFGAGVGYNFMMDEKDERWYTFIAIGYNITKK